MLSLKRGDIMSKMKTSSSLDQVVYDKIKALSELEDRSFSQQVNKILKDHEDKKKD